MAIPCITTYDRHCDTYTACHEYPFYCLNVGYVFWKAQKLKGEAPQINNELIITSENGAWIQCRKTMSYTQLCPNCEESFEQAERTDGVAVSMLASDFCSLSGSSAARGLLPSPGTGDLFFYCNLMNFQHLFICRSLPTYPITSWRHQANSASCCSTPNT